MRWEKSVFYMEPQVAEASSEGTELRPQQGNAELGPLWQVVIDISQRFCMTLGAYPRVPALTCDDPRALRPPAAQTEVSCPARTRPHSLPDFKHSSWVGGWGFTRLPSAHAHPGQIQGFLPSTKEQQREGSHIIPAGLGAAVDRLAQEGVARCSLRHIIGIAWLGN